MAISIRKTLILAFSLLAVSVSTPAAAQLQSQGYKFLEAVKKRESQEIIDMLAASNNQLVTSREFTTGDTALHIVARQRHLQYLKFLAQRGADVNAVNKTGESPLSIAVGLGWLEGIEYLLFRKARIDITNDTGETPLIQAVHQRSVDMIEMLLKAGADPDRNDNSGRSARDYAELDSRNSRILAAIEEHEREKAPAATYGPGG